MEKKIKEMLSLLLKSLPPLQEQSFVFFWKPEGPEGFLGNWWPAPFRDDLGNKFPTSEHYMMWRKALLMGDEKIAARVLTAKTPKYVKW